MPEPQRIKGYAPDEIIGQHFSTFYTPEDRAAGLPARGARRPRCARENTRPKAGASARTARASGLGGDRSALRGAAILIGFAKITRDITERRDGAERAADSERNFRLLVSGVTDYALYMLDPDGTRVELERRRRTHQGLHARRNHRPAFLALLHRAGSRRRPPGARAEIARETGRYDEEGWRVRKDGSFFWASVVIDPIRDEYGKLVGFAKITRDITERREAQMALAAGAAAARPIAEDGCARPAHRRRGARLQQPSDGRQRQHPDAEDDSPHRIRRPRAPRRRSSSPLSAAPP